MIVLGKVLQDDVGFFFSFLFVRYRSEKMSTLAASTWTLGQMLLIEPELT